MKAVFWQLFLFFLAFTASAQTTVKVLDGEKKGLPNAHVKYKALEAEKYNTILSNLDGIAEIPLLFCQNNPVFNLSITYIGFESVENDTVATGKTLRYVLKEDLIMLGQLAVTGQYSPNDPEKAVHKISIINSEKIEAMAAVTLTDVLTNELNMSIRQDNILGSQISMQGLDGENVKILIDGVPMIGRSDGNIDLNQINMENIERIEVIEGPMSVNYGTNALAGAINLITKKGSAQKWEGGVHAYTESVGKYNLNGHLNYRMGAHQIGISGGRNYFNGWNPEDKPYENIEPIADSTRFKDWKPKEQYMLNFQYAYHYKNWDFRYKGDWYDEKITSRGFPRGTLAFDDYLYTNRLDNSIHVSGQLSENFTATAIVAFNSYERVKNSYITDLTTLNQVLLENTEDQDTTRFNSWTIRGSVANIKANTKINYEIGYDINLEEGKGKRIDDGVQRQDDYALYASVEYKPFVSTTIRPGLRFAYNSNYDSPLIPSLNIKQDIGKIALRISYALGFRAPSLKEQYLYFVDSNHNIVGNPNLKPENSNNFNLSTRYTSIIRNSLFKAEVSGFYNNVENLIDLVLIQVPEYTYINVDRYKTTGVNANFKLDIHHFKIGLGASYIGRNYEFQSEVESAGFIWTPEAQVNLGFEFTSIGLSTSLFLKYQGKLPSFNLDQTDAVELNYIDQYAWADFTISKPFLQKRMISSIGVKNIFDVTSVARESSGGAIHGGSGSQPIGMGRSYFISLKYNFKSKK
jgi:outer membrane receptor for ferrienterochelin and colicins